MNRITFLLFLCLGLAPLDVRAAEASGAAALPQTAAQSFYDGYMKRLVANGDTKAYVLKSGKVTEDFKKAYRAFMKEPDSDPIICAQDYPDAGFAAGMPSVDGDRASVTMTSKDASFPHTFKVYLRKGPEGWKIAGTKDLLAPKS